MNNIIISGGLEHPWEIENTDTSVSQNLVLKNLAVGKLAYLGSQAALQVNAQKEVLQNVVDGVNVLSDKLDGIKNPLVWTADKVNLNIDDQVGLNVSSPGFKGEALVAATELMRNEGIDFGTEDHIKYFDPLFGIYKYIKISDIQVFSGVPSLELFNNLPELSLYKIEGSIKPGYYVKFYDEVDYIAFDSWKVDENFVKFVIPSTKNQLFSWENSKIIADAILKTDEISSKKELIYGIPISISDQIIIDNKNIPENEKSLIYEKYKDNIYSDVKINYDTVRLNIENLTEGDIYFQYPVPSVNDADLINIKSGELYTLSSDNSNEKKYFYATGSGSKVEVDISTQLKFFVLKPSATEVQSWRAQLAEKQIQLSQRSSELQNYLNELIQTYGYTFDAATNLLKLIANADSEIIRNF